MKSKQTLVRENLVTIARCNDALSFCYNQLSDVLNIIGISEFAIGGSVANLLYGCQINRYPHDIDVIVPPNIVSSAMLKVKNSPLFIDEYSTSSIDEEFGTAHFAFRCAKGPIIDIIEDPDYDHHNKYSIRGIKVMDYKVLIENKRDNYHRMKDSTDIIAMENYYQRFEPDSGSDNDIDKEPDTSHDLDALKALRAKLEGKA